MPALAAQGAWAAGLGVLLLLATAGARAQPASVLPERSVAQVLQPAADAPRAARLTAPAGVLLLRFADLREQSRALARVVLFIEKLGAPRHRVLNLAEVAQWFKTRALRPELVTLGNNLSAEELARFFNTARLQGEGLTDQEFALLRELLDWGVLRPAEPGWVPAGAVHTLLTAPDVSTVAGCDSCTVSPALRSAILEHELGHGEFAARVEWQHHARWFWFSVLSPIARSQWQRFLTQRGYDTAQLQIVLGEMHAFLDHTHDPSLFGPADLGMDVASFDAMRARYRAGLADRTPLRHEPGHQLP